MGVLSEEMGVTDGRRVWLTNRSKPEGIPAVTGNWKTMEAWKTPALLGQAEGRQPCLLCSFVTAVLGKQLHSHTVLCGSCHRGKLSFCETYPQIILIIMLDKFRPQF